MTATYDCIATTTITTNTATVSFTSISANYTDLILIANVDQAAGNNSLRFRLNNDSGSNYSATVIYGNGTSAISSRFTNETSGLSYASANTERDSIYIVQFMNYSNSTTYKTILSRSNRASGDVAADVNLWRNTAAINRIDLAMGGSFPTNDFADTTTLTLYGIKSE